MPESRQIQNAAGNLVTFSTVEVAQQDCDFENVFSEQTLFKSPNSRLKRLFFDPAMQEEFKYNLFLGHTAGKSAVRLACNPCAKNVHSFEKIKGNISKSKSSAKLLHYHMYNFSDFLKSVRNWNAKTTTFLSGKPIDPIKMAVIYLNQMANNESYLHEYYRRWIAFDKEEIAYMMGKRAWLRNRGRPGLVTIDIVRNIFINNIDLNSCCD